jgi:hypothetical protein
LIGADRIGVVELKHGERAACDPGSTHGLSELLELAAASGERVEAGRGCLTVEVLAQNDVDHAADGIRAVNGGGSVGEDIDAIDGIQRDHRQIDAAAVGGRRDAMAIDESQRGA